jgi:hypothetical protein
MSNLQKRVQMFHQLFRNLSLNDEDGSTGKFIYILLSTAKKRDVKGSKS